MATKDKLQGRAGQTQTQCKVTMRHSLTPLTPFRCYYQKIRRRKRKEEEKRGRMGERGRGRRRDGEMWRLKPLFHAEKGDGQCGDASKP